MALKLRLARAGAKKSPFYRLVVADSRSPRDGKFIEHVGIYDPTRNPAEVRIQLDRVEHWIKQGAQPTDTVSTLLRRARNEASAS